MKFAHLRRVALLLIVSVCMLSVDQAMAKGKKGKKGKGGKKSAPRHIESVGITKPIGQGPIPTNAEDLTEASPSGLTTLSRWKRPSKKSDAKAAAKSNKKK